MINLPIQKYFDKIFQKKIEKKEKVRDALNVGEFRIQFPLQKFYENNIISTPFTLSFQDSPSRIEVKMAEKYPELLTATSFDERLAKLFYQMQADIKKEMTHADKRSIESYFYKKRWFEPFFNFYERFIYFELKDFKLLIWKERPALRANGIIHIDFGRMFSEYYKSYIFVNGKKEFLKENFRITFTRRFPTLLTYFKETEFKDLVLKTISIDLNTLTNRRVSFIPNSLPWTKLLVKQLGRVEKYSKIVEWVSPTTIQVKITDWFAKLVDKAKQNPGKILVGGVIVGGVLNQRRIDKELEKRLNGK